MPSLPQELKARFDQKWAAFRDAAQAAGVVFADIEPLRRMARCVFACSDFVAASCIRDPDMLRTLAESGDLERSYRPESYREKLGRALAENLTENAFEQSLRRVRRYEMVRIAWRDLGGLAGLEETMADLSGFADACIDRALEFLYRRQCQTAGSPTGTTGLSSRWR